MAEPFSLAASVVGVAAAAFQISKKLHDLVQDFREAPGQLRMLADQIERDGIFLKCAMKLVNDHDALFKDELKGLIRDVNGQFANINGLIDKFLPKSRHRRRDKLKHMVSALWQSKKIEDITLQLEALRSTLALILNVAQSTTTSDVDLFRAQTSQTIEDCLRSLWNLHHQQHHTIPIQHRKLLPFDESPEDMAVWMAINLSAPTIPVKSLMGPEASGSSVRAIKSRTRPSLPFGPVSRAKPKYTRNGGAAGHDVEFLSGALDVRTLDTFGLSYQESQNPDGSSKLTIKREEALEPHEVDMIVGMDSVMKIPRSKNWSIDKTPFMYLPEDIVLCRLLTEWTTLDIKQIKEVAKTQPEEDAGADSDSDGGASTMASYSDDEYLTSNRKRHTSRQPLEDKAKRDRSRFGDSSLAARFSTDRLPYPGPPGYPYGNDGRAPIDPSLRYPVHGGSQQPAPVWGPPGLGQPRQPRAPGEKHFDPSYHGHGPGNLPPLPYPRRPPPAPPPPPSPPPPKRRDDFAKTVGDDAGERHRPRTPSMHDSPTTTIEGGSNVVKDTLFDSEHRPDPLVEIRRRGTEINTSKFGPAGAEAQKNDENDHKMNGWRGGDWSHVDWSKLERRNTGPKEDRKVSTGIAIPAPQAESEAKIRARIMKELEDHSWANTVSTQDAPPRSQHELEEWREQLKSEMRQEVEEEFQRQYDLRATYSQTYEKSYADMKRREAEERQFIENIKEQARDELRQEQEAAEKRAREDQNIRDRLRRIAEAERERVEAEQRARQSQQPKDDFIQQFKERPQDISSEVDESALIQNAIQRFKFPYVEYDIMSYVTEETDTTSSSSSGENAEIADEDDSDGTETVKTTVKGREQDEIARNSDVERSQPWKGPAYLGNFAELTPFYLRGSDAGQTWYHGPEPIYIIEFHAGYDGETSTNTDDDTAGLGQPHERPYLLVSKLWVDAEALDRFGFKYAEGPPSHFFLDPTLSWESIEVLVNFTYALREVETFKAHGQGNHNAARLLCTSPPPLDFFSAGDIREAIHPTFADQRSGDDAPVEERDAEDKQWSLKTRLAYPLSVLNFALHTIT
ncbi:hypothetical protein diail_3558 [Diaporthe ilicicola]|nr:hypothetical protein diail_3558 [Diaporthe ilicicola]